MSLTQAEINALKGRGFLNNRGTDMFSGRIVGAGGVFTAEQVQSMAELAQKFGNGKVTFTSRLGAEIPGIPADQIDAAEQFAKDHDIAFGGTGPKIRPVIACKGTTCVFGNYDTQALAKKIHEEYYLGWRSVVLPHKFKIGLGGCPNSCMKPTVNDFGVEGRPVAPGKPKQFAIYVGGTWGKKTREGGFELPRLFGEEEVLPTLEKTMLWYRENAFQKERLRLAIERLGFDKFLADIEGDDLLNRKAEILAADLKTK